MLRRVYTTPLPQSLKITTRDDCESADKQMLPSAWNKTGYRIDVWKTTNGAHTGTGKWQSKLKDLICVLQISLKCTVYFFWNKILEV
jgi:hypothetical protein